MEECAAQPHALILGAAVNQVLLTFKKCLLK